MKLTTKKIINLYKHSKVIKTCKELNAVYRNRDTRFPISFDTETTSVTFNTKSYLYQGICGRTDPVYKEINYPFAFGISMAIMSEGKIYLLWARHTQKALYKAACSILRKKCHKTAHNARYDIRVLKGHDVVVAPEVDCTYTQSRIYYDRRLKHSLKSLAEIICPELSGWNEPIKAELRKLRSNYTRKKFPKDYVNYSFIKDELMSEYSMLDSFWGLVLWIYFEKRAIWI